MSYSLTRPRDETLYLYQTLPRRRRVCCSRRVGGSRVCLPSMKFSASVVLSAAAVVLAAPFPQPAPVSLSSSLCMHPAHQHFTTD